MTATHARRVLSEARWQLSTGLLLVGPLLGVFGWAASFTVIGAVSIYAGVAMSVTGWLVLPTRRRLGFAVLGVFVEIGWIFAYFWTSEALRWFGGLLH